MGRESARVEALYGRFALQNLPSAGAEEWEGHPRTGLPERTRSHSSASTERRSVPITLLDLPLAALRRRARRRARFPAGAHRGKVNPPSRSPLDCDGAPEASGDTDAPPPAKAGARTHRASGARGPPLRGRQSRAPFPTTNDGPGMRPLNPPRSRGSACGGPTAFAVRRVPHSISASASASEPASARGGPVYRARTLPRAGYTRREPFPCRGAAQTASKEQGLYLLSYCASERSGKDPHEHGR